MKKSTTNEFSYIYDKTLLSIFKSALPSYNYKYVHVLSYKTLVMWGKQQKRPGSSSLQQKLLFVLMYLNITLLLSRADAKLVTRQAVF